MKTILICPGERRAVAHLSQARPLVCVPVFGETLIAFWMEYLVHRGVKEVTLLVTDRIEEVRNEVGSGERWGMNVTIVPELRELTAAEAQAKYPEKVAVGFGVPFNEPIVLDHFPGTIGVSAFTSYADWFRALFDWLPWLSQHPRVAAGRLSGNPSRCVGGPQGADCQFSHNARPLLGGGKCQSGRRLSHWSHGDPRE
jgi:hypothetical protein